MEIAEKSPLEKYLRGMDGRTKDAFQKVKKEIRSLQDKADKLTDSLKLQNEIKQLQALNFIRARGFVK